MKTATRKNRGDHGIFVLSAVFKEIEKCRIEDTILAELVMICGYFLFEGLLYGFAPSLVNIPANAVQAAAGVVIGVLLITAFENNIFCKA